jgi:hypothetical protein
MFNNKDKIVINLFDFLDYVYHLLEKTTQLSRHEAGLIVS